MVLISQGLPFLRMKSASLRALSASHACQWNADVSDRLVLEREAGPAPAAVWGLS